MCNIEELLRLMMTCLIAAVNSFSEENQLAQQAEESNGRDG